jgi:plastocyanin
MHKRVVMLVVGALLVGLLAMVGTAGVIAMKSGYGTTQRPVSQETVVYGATQVFIRDGAYTPAHIEVPVGTAVTWTNEDTVPHGVVFTPLVITTVDTWQSGPLYPGASFSYTFTSRGTFVYHCSEHLDMTGTVTVV